MIGTLLLWVLPGAFCVGFAVQRTRALAVFGGELLICVLSAAWLTLISLTALGIAYTEGWFARALGLRLEGSPNR